MTDEQNKDEIIPQQEPNTETPTPAVDEAAAPAVPAVEDTTTVQLNTPEISTPKKSKTGLIIGIAAAVVAVVVAILFATGAFADPQAAVAKAFAATQAASEKASAEMRESFPLMKLLYDTEEGTDDSASKSSFDLTFQSITTGTPDDTLLNGLLRGAGIRGAFATDPASKSGTIDLAAYYTGMDLVSLSSYISTELVTVAAPALSDTVFSFVPSTLVADAQGSAITELMGWTDADLQSVQDAFTTQADDVQSTTLDYDKFSKEIYAITGKALTNATYEKVGKQNGLTDYAITLTGADLKATLVELCRYIYVDSDLAATMEDTLAAQLAIMGTTYEQFIQNDMLQILENGLEVSDSTLTISVDSKSYIAQYKFAGALTVEGETINLAMDMSSPTPMEAAATVTADSPDGTAIKAVINTTYDGDFQDVAVTMDVNDGVGMLMNLTEEIRLGKDGTANLKADISMDDMKMGVDIQGSIIEAAGNYTIDYPVLKLLINDGYTDMEIALSATGKVEKLDGLTAPAQHTPLFSMTQDELATQMMAIQEAFYGVLNQVTGGLL